MDIYPKNQQVVILIKLQNHDAMWHVDVLCQYLMIYVIKSL